MKTCFIFGALKTDTVFEKIEKDDFIIAADSGIKSVRALGLNPNLILGDFDSLGYIPDDENKLVLPVEKDDTDVAFAVKYAVNEGAEKIIIYGAVGGCIDHSLANIQLSAFLSRQGVEGVVYGDGYRITSLTERKKSFTKTGENKRFSVFAVTEATGITMEGFKYCLKNGSLSPFDPMGVSNELTEDTATIEVRKGTLTIMQEL